jgi:F-type H+-transporting ATPase subunit b
VAAYFAELVGFAIFIGLIVWKVAPAVQRVLDRRRETIRSAIDGAEAVRKAAGEELERRKVLLEEARVEAAAILSQAEETAAQLREDGRAHARQDYERTIREAQAEIESETQRAREDVTREVGEIVLAAAEKVVRAELDPARQHALVDQVIAAARSTGAAR